MAGSPAKAVRARRRDTVALIIDELQRAGRPMSAYDLLDKLRAHGIGAPPTVYRGLAKLLDGGKIHRLESLNAFVPCVGAVHEDHDHAHDTLSVGFAICDTCGSVQEFVDPLLKARIEADAAATAFRPLNSSVEVHGICARCDNAQA